MSYIKRLLLLILCVFLLPLGGCGKDEDVALEDTPTPPVIETEPTETPQPESNEPELFNSDFVLPDLSVRPIAVMIDNQGTRVLPQGGISQAQIVYEFLTEYTITRYMLFFWGNIPDMVGPVRSARHYFLDYAMEYGAIYTHFGGSEYAKSDIKKLKINDIDGLVHGNAFWDITTDRGNWQDSYTSKERLDKQIEALKYSTEPSKDFPFSYYDMLTLPEGGTKAESIAIKYASDNYLSYEYDEETAGYLRFRMGQPQMERNTGEQVRVTNILIQITPSNRIANDKEGRINLENIGNGEGYYITGGTVVKLKWSKAKRDEQTVYTLEDGSPVVFNRGQTWIEVIPTNNAVTIKESP